MNNRILCSLFLVITLFSVLTNPHKSNQNTRLTILQINNKSIYPILDSIVCFNEKKGENTPDLYYLISIHKINDTINEMHIGAFDALLIFPEKDYYEGCFEYKNHWFFVAGQEYDCSLFTKTNKKKEFEFRQSDERDNNGEYLLWIIDDDSFPFWIYYSIQNKFIFKDRYTPE